MLLCVYGEIVIPNICYYIIPVRNVFEQKMTSRAGPLRKKKSDGEKIPNMKR